MLVKQLIRETLELQGFRIESVEKKDFELLTEAVDTVCRQEITEKGKEHKKLVAGSRYIWLKNPWNLTDGQKASLSTLEKLNLTIHRAYLLKESFRDFWQSTAKEGAAKYLEQWCTWAEDSEIKPMQEVDKLIRGMRIISSPTSICRSQTGSLKGSTKRPR